MLRAASRAAGSRGLGPGVVVVAFALAIQTEFLFFRLHLLELQGRREAALLPSAGLSDLVFVVLLASVCYALLRLVSGARRSLTFAALTVPAALALAAGYLNLEVIEMLGRPFDLQWLYYSDYLKGFNPAGTWSRGVWAEIIAKLVALLTIAGVGGLVLAYGMEWALRRYSAASLTAAAATLVVVYAGWAWAKPAKVDPNYLSNPLLHFARSVKSAREDPALFALDVPGEYRREFALRQAAPTLAPAARGGVPKNVLLFVLESVPAEHVQPFGGERPVTPNLAKYAAQAVRFSNIYSHVPSSIKSMVSILSGAYPWISYRTIPREHPAAPLPTLSELFAARGYRTLFLSPGDFRFGKSRDFLVHRRFNRILDFSALDCGGAPFEDQLTHGLFTGGWNDACMAREAADWIRADDGRPWFAVLWTYQTHYPYQRTGRPDETYAGAGEDLNRYLNSLRESDAAFGQVMRTLEESGAAGDTLVVIAGDHGEAFGRHRSIGHATDIYEENVHVPLMLVNRRLFAGEVRTAIGGHADIAPTIFDILGWDPPAAWQGRSLFAADRPPRAYFFTPYGGARFGMRDGEWSVLVDGDRGTVEVYNLVKDPLQSRNLAASEPGRVREAKLRIAAWMQNQAAFMERLFSSAGSSR